MAGGYVAHVVQGGDAQEIIQRVQDLVRGLSPSGKFPGPNPCSIERRDFDAVDPRNLWICEKTDGTRALCVALTVDGLKVCVTVTRSWEVAVVKTTNLPRVLFQGTVLDGELVFDPSTSRWTWLGFDAIVACGVPLWKLPFGQRLEAAHRALGAYAAAPDDSLCLRFKTFYRATDIRAFRGSSVPWSSDGVILTPDDAPVVVGRHPGMFKMKDTSKHSVDFAFSPPNCLSVYDPATRGHVVVGHLAGRNAGALIAPGSILECTKAPGGDMWTLVCLRRDKTTANDLLTYTKTYKVNIRESLTLDDLEHALNGRLEILTGPHAS